MQSRANVHSVNDFGATPLFTCCSQRCHDMAKLMIEHRAAVNHRMWPQTFAISFLSKVCRMCRRVGIVHRLIEHVVVTDGGTALIHAASLGEIELLQLLLDSLADVHLQNADGSNAIDVARTKANADA